MAQNESGEGYRQVGIRDVLEKYGFDPRCKTKLVRHTKFYNYLELYQATQEDDVFHECDFIVSFTGDGAGRAKFYGVYRVLEERQQTPDDIPVDSPLADRRYQKNRYFYELEPQIEYEHLRGQLVIDWQVEIAWCQNMDNKPVLEILSIPLATSRKKALPRFNDYLDFTLSYQELRELITNPADYRHWEISLSAVTGVYLVLAETTGELYVGSAYGENGIWGRWEAYAANGHGDNMLLIDLIETNEEYPEAFLYSVLQVLPKSTSTKEVRRWERLYKEKLGSRATGLNLN